MIFLFDVYLAPWPESNEQYVSVTGYGDNDTHHTHAWRVEGVPSGGGDKIAMLEDGIHKLRTSYGWMDDNRLLVAWQCMTCHTMNATEYKSESGVAHATICANCRRRVWWNVVAASLFRYATSPSDAGNMERILVPQRKEAMAALLARAVR